MFRARYCCRTASWRIGRVTEVKSFDIYQNDKTEKRKIKVSKKEVFSQIYGFCSILEPNGRFFEVVDLVAQFFRGAKQWELCQW